MKTCHVKFVAYTHVHLANKTCHIKTCHKDIENVLGCNRLEADKESAPITHGTEATKQPYTLLSIDNDLLRNIATSSLINDFALQKSCKHIMYTWICIMRLQWGGGEGSQGAPRG